VQRHRATDEEKAMPALPDSLLRRTSVAALWSAPERVCRRPSYITLRPFRAGHTPETRDEQAPIHTVAVFVLLRAETNMHVAAVMRESRASQVMFMPIAMVHGY